MSEALLVLYAHGSRDPVWRSYFEKLASDLQRDLEPDMVELAYMEFASPTLEDIVSSAYEQGVRRFRLLPLFFAGGAHVANDIPEQVDAVRALFPDATVDILPPVGEHRRFRTLLKVLAQEAALDAQATRVAARS